MIFDQSLELVADYEVAKENRSGAGSAAWRNVEA